jgi:hypothetical protein
MARTLSNDDIDAIADRVLERLAEALTRKPTLPEKSPPAAPPKTTQTPAQNLAFTRKELCAELKMSVASITRLEHRGLIKPVLGLRTKLYSRKEVERYLESTTYIGKSIRGRSTSPRET